MQYPPPSAIDAAAQDEGTASESASKRRRAFAPRRAQLWVQFLLAAGLMLLSVLWINRGIEEFVTDASWSSRAHHNLELIRTVYSLVRDAESAQRGMLLTGRDEFEHDYFESLPSIRLELANLRTGLSGSAEQLARVDTLEASIGFRIEAASDVMARYRNSGFEAAREEVAKGAGTALMEEIAVLTAKMEAAERDLLARREAQSERSRLLLRVIGLGGMLVSALILLTVFTGILREMRARSVAERAALAVRERLAASVAQLTELTAETRGLSGYAGMLQSCHAMEEALEVTRRTFRQLLPDSGGSVYLIRASSDLVEEAIAWGAPAAASAATLAPADCWALRRGQPHAVHDVHSGMTCAHVTPAADADADAAATLCIPLVAQSSLLGMVYLAGEPAQMSAKQALGIALGEQLSLATSNLRLQETLRTQSIRDSLTGLYNRRYLEESLARELSRCSRLGVPLAVLMLDVDHFKRFNDSHGHDGGDALLMELGKLLRASCRREDIACRFGGEEFTLILPELDSVHAQARAEDLRARIEALRVVHHHAPLTPVTASIGVSMFPADAATGGDLLRAADIALYGAKAQGRNRVVFA